MDGSSRTVAVILVVIFLLVAVVLAALGDVPGEGSVGPTLEGPCTGTAEVDGGPSIDPSQSGGIFTVPLQGSATYEGTVQGPTDGPERPEANGHVYVVLQAGFPTIDIGGAWPGGDNVITGIEETGVETWDVPAIAPRGVPFRVEGFHEDAGGILCTGHVYLQFEGGVTDSLLVWIVLAVVVVMLTLLILLARASGAGPAIGGGVVGLLLGISVAVLEVLFGLQPLDGSAVLILGVLGLGMGVAVGLAALRGQPTTQPESEA